MQMQTKAPVWFTVVAVLALLWNLVGCLAVAAEFGKTIVVDMICEPDIASRIKQLEAVGVRALAVHTGVDQQAAGRTPLDDLRVMKSVSRSSRIFVAGGINTATLPDYTRLGADVVIVGSGICHADDPVAAARTLHGLLYR